MFGEYFDSDFDVLSFLSIYWSFAPPCRSILLEFHLSRKLESWSWPYNSCCIPDQNLTLDIFILFKIWDHDDLLSFLAENWPVFQNIHTFSIGHWKKLHLKVSQGIWISFSMAGKNLIKVLSILIFMTAVSFINAETSSVTLAKDKVSKNAPKHEIAL